MCSYIVAGHKMEVEKNQVVKHYAGLKWKQFYRTVKI
jgi:hypothetical protein